MIFFDILWYSLLFIDILWYSLIFNGILWYSLMCIDILWYSLVFFDMLWYSSIFLIFFDIPLIFLDTCCIFKVLLHVWFCCISGFYNNRTWVVLHRWTNHEISLYLKQTCVLVGGGPRTKYEYFSIHRASAWSNVLYFRIVDHHFI